MCQQRRRDRRELDVVADEKAPLEVVEVYTSKKI
jgi:hypothetical protein